MAFNPADLFRVKSAAEKFNMNHPKLLPFFSAAKTKAMTQVRSLPFQLQIQAEKRLKQIFEFRNQILNLLTFLPKSV